MRTAGRTERLQGFSAIEIIIVVLIIAVLAAVSIPLIGHWLMQYRLGIAARQVADGLQATKMSAVAKTQRREFLFDLSGNRAGQEGRELIPLPRGVTFSAGSAKVPPESNVLLTESVNFPPSSANANLRSATFTGRGLPDGAPGRTYAVFLSNSAGTAVVLMTSAGNVRTLQWTGTEWR